MNPLPVNGSNALGEGQSGIVYLTLAGLRTFHRIALGFSKILSTEPKVSSFSRKERG
jgi:hypothetical protein